MQFKINTDIVKRHMALSQITKDKFTASCLINNIDINCVLDNNKFLPLDTIIKLSRLIKINVYYLIK